MNSIES